MAPRSHLRWSAWAKIDGQRPSIPPQKKALLHLKASHSPSLLDASYYGKNQIQWLKTFIAMSSWLRYKSDSLWDGPHTSTCPFPFKGFHAGWHFHIPESESLVLAHELCNLLVDLSLLAWPELPWPFGWWSVAVAFLMLRRSFLKHNMFPAISRCQTSLARCASQPKQGHVSLLPS